MTDKTSIPKKPNNSERSVGTLHTMKDLGGQVKNTVKDIVSVLKGHYAGAEKPDSPLIIRKTLESDETPEFWKDWRWQLRHAIRDIATFEQVIGI
ncbi:MAG: hypothetical protein PHF57_14250, partial [Methanoregula sp.]|nr:hypothetical protein [Methanoregula sp.]